jgi:hypothetical protein
MTTTVHIRLFMHQYIFHVDFYAVVYIFFHLEFASEYLISELGKLFAL